MTDFAALAQQAVQFMAANQAAVDAHPGAAYAEGKILRALCGVEDSGSRGLIGYAHQCVLQRGVPAVNNRAEAYNFTHTVMFATDFGRKTISGFDQTAYTAALDVLVVTYAGDLDVLGELLICAKCIGYWSVQMDAALVTFTAGWTALDRGDFAQNYHTILVGGLLFSMLG